MGQSYPPLLLSRPPRVLVVLTLGMRFPVFALIAPIVTSLVLWMVTKSPYTLLFALMGPVMAVASFLDGRFGERRRQRSEAADRERQLLEEESSRLQEEARLRRELRHAHPAPGSLSSLDVRARPPWSNDLVTGGEVRLGLLLSRGRSPSNAARPLPAAPSALLESPPATAARDLIPLLARADAGLVCVGNPLYGLSFARAVWMQLAWNVAPEVLRLHPSGYERDVLTHPQAWPVSLVGSEREIPPAVRYVIEILSPNEGRLIDRDDPRSEFTTFIPDYITAAEASAFAARLAEAAQRVTDSRPGAQLPAQCTVADLMPDRRDGHILSGRTTLIADVGMSVEGVFGLDLVAHGPHAVVTGMTGTGKTEFLVSWMLSVALRYSPQEFTVVIIDFKGGSGFARVSQIPHCLGVMTDLDVPAAHRALLSLRAELRFRERTLAEAGVTDFRDLPASVPLARLVIVVDEYRALLDMFAELQPLFLDIAARGRALGIHLILGTQRATGVLADGILANCALRIVFRVNNVSDSMALLETDAARTLPEIPGRAALRGSSLALTYVQVARTTDADAQRVGEHASRWLDAHPLFVPRRPWLPALPPRISLAELEKLPRPTPPRSLPSLTAALDHSVPTPLVLGLLDEPEEQRQSIAQYVPDRDGHLLVSGDQGSGRSAVLRLLRMQVQSQSQQPPHAPAVSPLPSRRAVSLSASDPEAAWDIMTESGGMIVADGSLLFIDDIEALVAHFALEHRDVFLESLMALLRTGPGRGIYVVIASHGGVLYSAAWMALMKSTLALGHEAGRGTWQGHAVQMALPGGPPSATPAALDVPAMQWKLGHQYVVVTPRPRVRTAEVAHAGSLTVGVQVTDVGRRDRETLHIVEVGTAQVFIGDVEDWQSEYALLAQLRTHATFIFDDCSPAEVRAVRRSRDVLPHARRGTALCVSPDGVAMRVRLC